MKISVVVPAYNTAGTIAETLESLCAQTLPSWEAFIIDDGSTDETAVIAATFVERDPRIRLITQPHLGACVARNKGLQLSNFEWLLFLDADDYLLAQHLEKLSNVLCADSSLDAVYCGWNRVGSNGVLLPGEQFQPTGDLFKVFAHRCPFPPAACVVRRSAVEAAGGWDPSFHNCQDWDFWQRVARIGAQFGVVPEVLVHYHMRVDSVSTQSPHLSLINGLRVINQAYAPDARVAQSNPDYEAGLSSEDLSFRRLVWVCWTAGLVLGRGQDARTMLDVVKEDHCVEFDPDIVADCIFRSVPFGLCQPFTIWHNIWTSIELQIERFLQAFERQTQAPALATRSRAKLEQAIVETLPEARPLTIGLTHAVKVEMTQPVQDVTMPLAAKRLYCTVDIEEKTLGTVMLEENSRVVKAERISSAIAEEYAWPILGRFFEHTLYPHLRIERKLDNLSLWRGALCLATDLPDDDTYQTIVHDRVGWTVFLQELWGRSEWVDTAFYDPQTADEPSEHCYAADTALTIEISDALPAVVTTRSQLDVTLNVGGVVLGQITLPVKGGLLSPQEMRAALTTFGGLDLCRLVVRVALIGRSLSEPASLRTRLIQGANERHIIREPFTSRIRSFIVYRLTRLFNDAP